MHSGVRMYVHDENVNRFALVGLRLFILVFNLVLTLLFIIFCVLLIAVFCHLRNLL